MKKVFIIPGNFNYPNKKVYFKIKETFEKQGYEATIFWPNWWNTLSEICQDFLIYYDKNKEVENILFGFSYGSMIAFKTSLSRNINKLILCSLSPYFKEDLWKIPFHYKLIALPRIIDFISNWKFNDMIKNFSTPAIILYGSNENRQLIFRAKELYNIYPKLIMLKELKNVNHDISRTNYLNSIASII